MEAFSKVDELVSKPILGSDGAKAWQDFAKTTTSSKHNAVSVAPQAPLKAQERAMGYTSWHEERQQEVQRRQNEGQVSLEQAGYTHFKQKQPPPKGNTAKKSKRKSGAFSDEEEDEVVEQTEAYLHQEKELEETNDTTADNEVSTKKRSKKRKAPKQGPTIVHDPQHPLEQVAAMLQSRVAASSMEEKDDVALPHGWQSATDPASGKTYYYHTDSGERTWTRPRTETTTTATTIRTALPDGWTTAQDPATGKTYYYHAATQITQWDPPNASECRELDK